LARIGVFGQRCSNRKNGLKVRKKMSAGQFVRFRLPMLMMAEKSDVCHRVLSRLPMAGKGGQVGQCESCPGRTGGCVWFNFARAVVASGDERRWWFENVNAVGR